MLASFQVTFSDSNNGSGFIWSYLTHSYDWQCSQVRLQYPLQPCTTCELAEERVTPPDEPSFSHKPGV